MTAKKNANRKPRREIFECPNCGADVPVGAKSCKECGSDDTTGWQSSEQVGYAGVDLPDGYRAGTSVEGDDLPPVRTAPWIRWTALIVAAAMVCGLVAFVFLRRAPR